MLELLSRRTATLEDVTGLKKSLAVSHEVVAEGPVPALVHSAACKLRGRAETCIAR